MRDFGSKMAQSIEQNKKQTCLNKQNLLSCPKQFFGFQGRVIFFGLLISGYLLVVTFITTHITSKVLTPCIQNVQLHFNVKFCNAITFAITAFPAAAENLLLTVLVCYVCRRLFIFAIFYVYFVCCLLSTVCVCFVCSLVFQFLSLKTIACATCMFHSLE